MQENFDIFFILYLYFQVKQQSSAEATPKKSKKKKNKINIEEVDAAVEEIAAPQVKLDNLQSFLFVFQFCHILQKFFWRM